VLLGDFVRAQHESGDLTEEFENFFECLELFEVPVFAVPGNHDLYVNGVDGKRLWQENLGPLYYSFDAGGCHFSVVDTYQWPYGDRVVMEKLWGLIAFPRKWQGRVLGASDEEDPATYGGELAWLRDDLEANRNAGLRVVLLHHDPYTPDGEGAAFENERFAGAFEMGGGGTGGKALCELFSRYDVDMVMSGHLHQDDVGSEPWDDKKGETVYANQTCVYFDEGGTDDDYPGYRLVEVNDGGISEFAYMEGEYSYPLYDGSVPGGETYVEGLRVPALSAVRTDSGDASEGGSWEVRNYLAKTMSLRGLVVLTDTGAARLAAKGGAVYREIRLPGGKNALYLETEIPAGKPGLSASRHGSPEVINVKLEPLEVSPP